MQKSLCELFFLINSYLKYRIFPNIKHHVFKNVMNQIVSVIYNKNGIPMDSIFDRSLNLLQTM